MIRWVDSDRDIELRDVSNALRGRLQRTRGIAWLSHRTLCHQLLRRGHSRTPDLIRELVQMGEVCRVSARGRGYGKGRTLYWLPGAHKSVVLAELEREKMPAAAIAEALSFFPSSKAPRGERTQSLRSSTFGTDKNKVSLAPLGEHSRAPSGPLSPRPAPHVRPSTPPPLGRLARHGLERVGVILPRITDDPATHPRDCGCGQHGGT